MLKGDHMVSGAPAYNWTWSELWRRRPAGPGSGAPIEAESFLSIFVQARPQCPRQTASRSHDQSLWSMGCPVLPYVDPAVDSRYPRGFRRPSNTMPLLPNANTHEHPHQLPAIHSLVFTAQCTLVQSAVLRSHVVCLSVCLSVCDVGDLWSHRLEILETNCRVY